MLRRTYGPEQSHGAQDVDNPWPADPYYANHRDPDARYKADVLVVVAHPDDEIMAAAYIPRIIEQGKRVAVVRTTRGDGRTNVIGPEQAAAMRVFHHFRTIEYP